MKLPIYQVAAFASKPFSGNPAAVCVLDNWLDDEQLQAIARENNLSETAFVVALNDEHYHLRWFTPSFEIPLCGHATLAAAYVLFRYRDHHGPRVLFQTQSGELGVQDAGERLVMDFPAYRMTPIDVDDDFGQALGGDPVACYRAGINLYALFEHESQVRSLQPDYDRILRIMARTGTIGMVPTAPGKAHDFVSRYFAPEAGTGITEDPVTGSIHCALIPFWAERLGKQKMIAWQASQRGGELTCEMHEGEDPRVGIAGQVQPYLTGEISL